MPPDVPYLPAVGSLVYFIRSDTPLSDAAPMCGAGVLPALVLAQEAAINAVRLRVFASGGDFTALALSARFYPAAARVPAEVGPNRWCLMPAPPDPDLLAALAGMFSALDASAKPAP